MSGKVIGILRKEKPRAEPELLSAADVSIERGIDGDFRGTHSENKVTLVSIEDWNAACAELDRDLPWTTRRANLCTQGIALPKHKGAQLRIGVVVLEVIDETAPCIVMERASRGLKAALTPDWRGGISCTVREPGAIALGDAVEVI